MYFQFIIVAWSTYLTGCASQWQHAEWETSARKDLTLDLWIKEQQTRQSKHLSPDVVCAQCHRRQAQEFAGSTMRYALISPVFNALEHALNQVGDGIFTTQGEQANFCSECHGPQEVSSLSVTQKQVTINSSQVVPNENLGISCDFCHTLQSNHAHGFIASQVPKPTPQLDKIGPNPNAVPNEFHGINQDTTTHTRLQQSQFCGSCHDVRPKLPDAVTKTAILRSEDLFSEWQSSPWSQAEHPQNPMRGMTGIIGVHDDQVNDGEQVTCQDCHMSLYPYRSFTDQIDYQTFFDGVDPSTLQKKTHKLYPIGVSVDSSAAQHALFKKSYQQDVQSIQRLRRVSTHHFTGVSHPMMPYPLVNPIDLSSWYDALQDPLYLGNPLPTSQSRWQIWRQADAQLTDTYGHPLRSFERRRDLLKAAIELSLDEVPSTTSVNQSLQIPIWIENIGAGHRVPAGFSQEREMWIHLEVLDQGRPCTQDIECQDLIEAPFFLDNINRTCLVYDHLGQLDPALDAESNRWEELARRERSAFCSIEGYCGLYRSGYLLDLDGDGRLNDEDLRHTLVDIDTSNMRKKCELPGPDQDVRVSGRQKGLIHFTNALQTVATDDQGDAIPFARTSHLRPQAQAYNAYGSTAMQTPVLMQATQQRRSLYATQASLFERWRYQPTAMLDAQGVMRRGLGLNAAHLLMANRAYNGASLAPFEPRLALYKIDIPSQVVGPLLLDARVRFRFFSPRLLRTLAQRSPQLLSEQMIDQALSIVDMQHKRVIITIDQ